MCKDDLRHYQYCVNVDEYFTTYLNIVHCFLLENNRNYLELYFFNKNKYLCVCS
jgi:hypothetical protein